MFAELLVLSYLLIQWFRDPNVEEAAKKEMEEEEAELEAADEEEDEKEEQAEA